jgi:PPK2 family polyphosphate:nucleotide phosphotransferase
MARIQLNEISTRAPEHLNKQKSKEETEKLIGRLDELQDVLYAGQKHAVLIILQGIDASGKDGAIRKVFSRLNPEGVQVTSFKEPTPEEKRHDFLWRVHQHAPAKGLIQIFNRSHYEEVLITRVHGRINEDEAQRRFQAINHFESLLYQHNQTSIFKFYLHISREEQQQRFAERLEDPRKNWKYNPNDEQEAAHWHEYRAAYEDMFEHCNHLPWVIVPSDQNWYKEYLIAKTVVDHLETLKMTYPPPVGPA